MIELLSPGPLATVQDLGRPGLAELGVSRSGAFDRSALRLANRLVGNDESAAGIEFTLGGLVLRVADAATLAFTGAPCELSGHRGGWNAALSCPAGSVLSTGTPVAGVRSYLAAYVVAVWREYYNPEMYRDAGIADPVATARTTWAHPATAAHRRALTSRCLELFSETGVLVDEVAL